jgi:hypothetical protein
MSDDPDLPKGWGMESGFRTFTDDMSDLRRENDRLRGQLLDAMSGINHDVDMLRGQVVTLNAENAMLRSALEDLMSWMDVWLSQTRNAARTAEWAVDAIEAGRKALNPETD